MWFAFYILIVAGQPNLKFTKEDMSYFRTKKECMVSANAFMNKVGQSLQKTAPKSFNIVYDCAKDDTVEGNERD